MDANLHSPDPSGVGNGDDWANLGSFRGRMNVGLGRDATYFQTVLAAGQIRPCFSRTRSESVKQMVRHIPERKPDRIRLHAEPVTSQCVFLLPAKHSPLLSIYQTL